jgi:hypothetical protein
LPLGAADAGLIAPARQQAIEADVLVEGRPMRALLFDFNALALLGRRAA